MTIPVDIYGVLSECPAISKSMKGQKIVNMQRFSSWKYEDYSSRFDEDFYFPRHEFFAKLSDPLLIEVESGALIGFNATDEINSVSTWVEVNEIGETEDESALLRFDEDFFAVEVTNKEYSNSFWWNFVGKTILDVQILRQKPKHVLYEDLPNEVAVMITVESGESFLMMHTGGGDFGLSEISLIQDELDSGEIYPVN